MFSFNHKNSRRGEKAPEMELMEGIDADTESMSSDEEQRMEVRESNSSDPSGVNSVSTIRDTYIKIPRIKEIAIPECRIKVSSRSGPRSKTKAEREGEGTTEHPGPLTACSQGHVTTVRNQFDSL